MLVLVFGVATSFDFVYETIPKLYESQTHPFWQIFINLHTRVVSLASLASLEAS